MKHLNYIDIYDTSEGLQHDLWNRTTIVFVNIEGTEYRYSTGIDTSLYIDGVEVMHTFMPKDTRCEVLFEELTGMTPELAEKLYLKHFYVDDPMGHPSQYI